MKKKKKGSHGAISVFLAIILVPCIVVSSVFVDLSRVHLSKTTAESSADLALNALLTNYDADLKDWYGMVASCQTIEQFYTVSAEYFLRALSSQGMTDDEIVLLSDYYSAATGEDTIYDLLQVECKSGTEGMVNEVAGANLSNAALMKDQIVEFMKYRAPIEITTGLIGRLTSDSTVMQAIEAEKTEPLVEDKREFYSSEGELTEAAFNTFKAIKAYYLKSDRKLTNDALSEKYGRLAEYKTSYKEILRYVIGNLSNTNGLQRYSRFTITKTVYNDLYSNPTRNFSEVYSEKKNVDGTDTYYIDLEDVQKLVEDLQKKVDAFNTAKANFNSAAQPVLNKLPYGDGAGQITPIQWWVQMNQAVNASTGTNHTGKIETAAQNMMRAYSRVLAIDGCELRGEIPTGWTTLTDWKTEYGADSLISTVESLQATYLTAGITNNNDTYLKAVKNLESVSSSQHGNISASNLYVKVDGQNLNLNAALSQISSSLAAIRQEMQDYVDLLNKAIDGDGGDTPSLDGLKDYVTAYEQNLKDWSDTANSLQETKMGKQDQEEIRSLQENIKIEEEDLTVLKTRLKNIRSQLNAVIEAIDSLKWGSKVIKDIANIDTFKSEASISTAQMGSTNGEIDSYTDNLFAQKFAPQTIPTMEHVNDTTYNPQISPITREVNTPDLWVYLYDKYERGSEAMEQATSEKDDANKKADEAAKAAKDNPRFHGSEKNVKWEFSDNTQFELDDVVTGLVGVVGDLVSLDFTGMRDDLYATTYVMEMFSYATFENQGKYNLLKETNPDVITQLKINNYPEEYQAVEGKEATDRKTWASANPEDAHNKSLTNKMINWVNNAAYGAEVEYILCGNNGSANADNVKAVYNKIYALRYGLNLVSGFANFWNKPNPTAMAIYNAALAISTMTSGIVPIPVTQAVLIPIITVFETSTDLDRLEAGFPVELYKTDHTMWWWALGDDTQPSGIAEFMNSILEFDPKKKNNTDNGLFYSDYLTLFVYLGFNSDAQQGMYQRMAEVIQFNIGTMADDDSYSLTKSRMYFRLKADLRVKPLMITLPFFSQDEYSNEMTTRTDWCTYDIDTVRGYN